jgi:amino acid adenylation domain-containing protein
VRAAAPVLEHDDLRVTGAELGARVDAAAAALAAAGVGPGDRVGVGLEPGVELVVALLAIWARGAAYVPFAPSLPAERKDAIVRDAGLRWVLTEPVGAGAPVAPVAPADRPAYVIYTSGTTGVPKGIEIRQRGLVSLVSSTQRRYGLGPDDAVLFATPIAFDASVLDVFWPLAAGARVIVAPADEARDPVRLVERARRHGATVLQLVPTQLEALCAAAERGEVGALPLRLLISGGALLGRALRDRFQAAFPDCRLANHYGPTEVTVDATAFDCHDDFTGAVVPIGRPVDNAAAYVLDTRGNLVPPGVKGEICVASPGLATRYVGDPERTAARFFVHPRLGERLYRTGDVGRWGADGQLYFLGRVDKQVKVRGNRVELEEVEAHLDAHALVDTACAAVEASGARLIAWVKPARHASEITLPGGRLHAFTLAQRPDLRAACDRLHLDQWPEFFIGDESMRACWPRLLTELADWQFLFVDEHDRLVAVGHCAPIHWDGTPADMPAGWDDGLRRALALGARAPNTLLGLAGVVDAKVGGRGLSVAVLEGFRTLAHRRGLAHMLGPVRPTGKADHPDLSFEEWCARRRPDGSAEDGWIRSHERLGARTLGVAPRSQRVVAPVADWERWAGRRFAASGPVHVPGTLAPVLIDLERGVGEYDEPCLWMLHAAAPSLPWIPFGAEELRRHLRARVPEYMVPDAIRFVLNMPTTASGKVDERALAARAPVTPAPAPIAAPKSPLEERLVGLWREVLGVERLGVADDFFDLGGHSLAAVRMLSRFAQDTGRAIPLRDFYSLRTIARLAAALEPSP